jgi:hypothetical protein
MGGFPCCELKALVAPRQCGLTPGVWGLRRGGGEGGGGGGGEGRGWGGGGDGGGGGGE